MASQNKIYKSIGLMSGTSYDGIDIGLIETDGDDYIKLLNARTVPYPEELREAIATLIRGDYTNLWNVECELSELHKSVTQKFIHEFASPDIIGFHGQSIHHNPAKGICAQI